MLRNPHTLSESTQIKAKYPVVAWKAIAGFRNVVLHDYLGVDLDRIWDIVIQDLPPLKQSIQDMLDAL